MIGGCIMSYDEFTPEYIFVDGIITRIDEINNYVKILGIVALQDEESYYLQDFVNLIESKQDELSMFIEEGFSKKLVRVLKQK